MHAGSRMVHYACSSPMAAVPARPAAPRTGPAGSYATRPLSRGSSGAPQAATHVHTVAGRGTRCTGGRAAGSAATRAACLPRRVKITWQKVGHTDDTLHARWSGPQYHSATGQGNSRHPQQKLARVIPSPTAPTSHGARAPTSTLRMREATGCDPHQTPIERGQLRACQAAGHRPVLAGCRTVGQLRERSKELCSLTVCRSALTPSHTICHLHTRCSCTVSWGRAVCSAELTNRPKRSETAQTILQTLGRDNGQRQSVLLVREDQRRAAVRSSKPAYFGARLFKGDSRSAHGSWAYSHLHCGRASACGQQQVRPRSHLQCAAPPAMRTMQPMDHAALTPHRVPCMEKAVTVASGCSHHRLPE